MPYQRRTRTVTRRKTGWAVGPEGIVTLAAAGAAVIPTGLQVTADGLTLTRIRGLLSCRTGTRNAAGDGADFAIGIGMTTDEAWAVGASALPSAKADEDWDGWLWHQYWHNRGQTTTIADQWGCDVWHVQIDCKAQRKWMEGMTVFATVEMDNLNGATSAAFNLMSRVLVLQP